MPVNTIFDNYQNIPLSENYIKQLHQILMRFSNKDERHRGEYKKDSNRVAAFDANGNEIEVEVTEYPDIPVIVVNADDEENKE